MRLQHKKHQLIILMTLLFFVSQATTDMYVPGLPLMTREFHTTINRMSLTITMFVYMQAIFFLFVGVISNLVGRRKVLFPGIIVLIISSFLIAISHSLTAIILLRVFQAIGSSIIYIVLRLIIKDVMNPKEQVKYVGIFVTALPLSLAVSPVVGAWVIEFWGWRACFVLIGVIQLLLFIWSVTLIDESNLQIKEFRKNFNLVSYIGGYLQVLSNKLFWSFVLIICGVFASYYSFISISSYMYIDEYHASRTIYSYTFIAIAAFYLAGNQIMLMLNRHGTSIWKLIKLGIYVSLAGLFFILLSISLRSETWFILGFITWGVVLLRTATAFINPPIQVEVTNYFDANGAPALGLLSCFQYMSASFGSLVVANLPLLPSFSLVVSSVIFCSISLFGMYLCPKHKLKLAETNVK